MRKFLVIIFLFLLISCDKEGIYIDEYDNSIMDSTVYVSSYYVYSGNEVVYEEEINKIYKLNQIPSLKDSLSELHKDKYDWFYLESY